MVAVFVARQNPAPLALPYFGRTLRRAKHYYGMMKTNTTDAAWSLSQHALLSGYQTEWIN